MMTHDTPPQPIEKPILEQHNQQEHHDDERELNLRSHQGKLSVFVQIVKHCALGPGIPTQCSSCDHINHN
eukprot:TRINITY_DN25595_c0_g1_i1.p2 TRINITY_DN25595_c0_g1~~TRINITY_DN25595_c0_g1_i1.p2  ORF type:complete len:70 (+),score=0.17 TRINITY_DN25595_c0_g1_i1:69-278(+)